MPIAHFDAADRVLGCLLGGMVGDAAGATLEFSRHGVTDERARCALDMPGAGALAMGRGQVTDDSELALALSGALLGGHEDEPLDVTFDRVAASYARWHASMPFDCGGTCGRAFAFSQAGETGAAHAMATKAAKYSELSEANGALMRCGPIACVAWARDLSDEATSELARRDAALSHPSPACAAANAVFCVAIVRLLRGESTASAIAAAEKTAAASVAPGAVVAEWLELSRGLASALSGEKRTHWRTQRLRDVYEQDCRTNVGHVKHGLVLAFAMLRADASFEEAIFRVLALGGDTDTNACICGYLLGAAHGASAIPERMRDPVLRFDCTTVATQRQADRAPELVGHARPREYRADNVLSHARGFLLLRRRLDP